jgi:hypothetical protein
LWAVTIIFTYQTDYVILTKLGNGQCGVCVLGVSIYPHFYYFSIGYWYCDSVVLFVLFYFILFYCNNISMVSWESRENVLIESLI